jgi:hypothetical protein
MIKNVLRTKVGSSVAVATVITMASGIGVASAHHGWFKMADESRNNNVGYYTKDQCKNGGWRQFKDENGNMLFRNQGQCVAFFASGGNVNGNHGQGRGDGDNDADDNNHNGGNHHHDNHHHHWWEGLAFSFWNHGNHR